MSARDAKKGGREEDGTVKAPHGRAESGVGVGVTIFYRTLNYTKCDKKRREFLNFVDSWSQTVKLLGLKSIKNLIVCVFGNCGVGVGCLVGRV